MRKKYFILIPVLVFLCCSWHLSAQDIGTPMEYIVEGNDTLFISEIPPAVKRYRPPRGKKGKPWREYYRLVHNFAKAYPYALLAKEKLEEADKYVSTHDLSPKAKDKYLSKFEDELFKTFEKPLKNLTFTQGRILLRLIDREVGLSSYSIIKSYRGGAAAGFWQGIAKLFGSDLKKPYDKFNEDKKIEDLVLLYQSGEFNTLYITIFGKYPPKPVAMPSPAYDYPQRFVPSY